MKLLSKLSAVLIILSMFFACNQPVEKVEEVTENNIEKKETESISTQPISDYKQAKWNEPGVELVTLKNGYKVFTQRVGDGEIKLLTLHGGPGCTHEYFEIFSKYFPNAGIQVIYYDQLGSYFSDQPEDTSLWVTSRFVEEVEEVRQALDLEDFYILGNSWGGILLMEYALKYPENLKGMIISNMQDDIDEYVAYLEKLRQKLPKALVDKMKMYEAKGDFGNEEYLQIVTDHLYKKHICRLDPWPEPVDRMFEHLAFPVYVTMQGPNEFHFGGNLNGWSRKADLHKIEVPTLVISGRHDSMDPEAMEDMGKRLPNARQVICENGSHMTFWDDEECYHNHVISFINDVQAGKEL